VVQLSEYLSSFFISGKAVKYGGQRRTYITNASINCIMKEIAKACYGLDAKQIGQYSTHSVRVDAAVHLHSSGEFFWRQDPGTTPIEIQQVHGVLA
jgi:hypothetical protein